MSLVLELSPETENRLREVAARAGRDVQSFIIEAALQSARRVYSMEEAAQTLRLSSSYLELLRQRGELSCEPRDGEPVFLHDAKFETLLQSQNETEAALREIAAQSQALGLYDECRRAKI